MCRGTTGKVFHPCRDRERQEPFYHSDFKRPVGGSGTPKSVVRERPKALVRRANQGDDTTENNRCSPGGVREDELFGSGPFQTSPHPSQSRDSRAIAPRDKRKKWKKPQPLRAGSLTHNRTSNPTDVFWLESGRDLRLPIVRVWGLSDTIAYPPTRIPTDGPTSPRPRE